MSTNYIERTRLAHEIIDRTEAIICEDLAQNIRLVTILKADLEAKRPNDERTSSLQVYS
jgi:hypothetical protein